MSDRVRAAVHGPTRVPCSTDCNEQRFPGSVRVAPWNMTPKKIHSTRRAFVFVLCLSCSAIGGCRRTVSANVSGKVDYDGTALNSGYIEFLVNNSTAKGGTISPDGTYSISGLPFGSAVVSIYVEPPPPPPPKDVTPTAIPGTYEENPVLIPKKYGSVETSGINIQVAMPRQVFDIHLEKVGKTRPK
jgi:hypothetical protein